MADENPYAKYITAPAAPAEDENPYAKYLTGKKDEKAEKPKVSTAEDVAKVAAPSVGRGVIGMATMPSTLADLVQQGVDWGIGKVSPETLANLERKRAEAKANPTALGKVRDAIPKIPNYSDAMHSIEAKTGPWYEAQTPVGKGVAVGLETAPGLLAGGGGALLALTRAFGAGAGSAAAGEGISWLKNNTEAGKAMIPEWAEPVARGVGAMGGTGFAPLARKVVTPLPMSAEQQSVVAALKAKDPNFPMSAGQETGRPVLQGLEARSPRMADLPKRQEEAFTAATMREMGSDGAYNAQNLKKGADIWPKIENLAGSYTMQQPEFQSMNQAISKARRDFESVMGQHNSGDLRKLEQEIAQGASGGRSGQVIGMPGQRYLAMRQKLQGAFEGASHPMEKQAIGEMKNALDQAMYNTMGGNAAAELKHLNNQYGNYAVLKNAHLPFGKETVTPKEVGGAVSKAWGDVAVNENHGTLVPLAKNAQKVMTPMEKPLKEEGGPVSKVGGALAAYILDKLVGHSGESTVAAILGSDVGPALTGIVKNSAGRVLATPPAQAYLKNQVWLPGQNTAAMDRGTLLRLLASPTERQYLGGGQSQ